MVILMGRLGPLCRYTLSALVTALTVVEIKRKCGQQQQRIWKLHKLKVHRPLSTSVSRMMGMRMIFLTSLILLCSHPMTKLSSACYLYPAGMPDPCLDKACLFGSRCVASADGHLATCECPTSCPNYGDSDDSQPVCGSNGINYKNKCELDREACRLGRNITIRYEGKCGKFQTNQFLLTSNIYLIINTWVSKLKSAYRCNFFFIRIHPL